MLQEIKNSTVKLTKVVLYKHGIGYFERRGKVQGPAKLELVCGPEEIDDMLKSLLALTTSGGRIDSVTYDSSKTLESRLAEFGFDLTQTEGLCGLLAQMKGIPVTVSVSGESVSGRVLGLDTSEQMVREVIVHEMLLTLYSQESTFKRIPLSSISAIKVDDETMALEMRQQLELLFQNAKKKDRKSLSVTISDPGSHDVLIAYSIPCPIWKTSYRLVMSQEGTTLLQGMAIVDNVQEEDWSEVQVVLVSASPISFIQPLYDPVQPARPVIATQGYVSAGPVTAERAQRSLPRQQTMTHSAVLCEEPMDAPCALGMVAPAPASPRARSIAPMEASLTDMMSASMSETLSVEASESGEQFEYRIENLVTIPRNSSALLPIVQETVEGNRISLYNASKNPRFPYSAVRFKNSTRLTLEAGPVTVMESDTYAGEALLDTVKPGDTRYLLYAVDQSLPIVVRTEQESKPIWRVRCVGSGLYMDYRARSGKKYQIDNLADRAKTLYIEHPINQGWALTSKPDPAETTERYYRFVVEMEPQKSHELEVWEETDTHSYMWLSNVDSLDVSTIDWICAQNLVNKEFLNFLKQILLMRAEIIQLRTEINTKKAALDEHVRDQKRARENLQSLGTNNERFRKVIDTAEDKIEQDRVALQQLTEKVQAKQYAFQNFVTAELVSELETVVAR